MRSASGSAEERLRPVLTYPSGDSLYLNLTNRCPTACSFCIKRSWKWRFEGYNLKLNGHEPTATEASRAIRDFAAKQAFTELVFCGYGECTYRLPVMMEVGRQARMEFPGLRRRLNTIGLGNLIWRRSIVDDLRSCLEEVSVSLNTSDPRQWLEFHCPYVPYRSEGFASVLEFIRECVAAGLETTITAIDLPKVDLNAVRQLACSLDTGFSVRPLLAPERPYRQIRAWSAQA